MNKAAVVIVATFTMLAACKKVAPPPIRAPRT
jgi:hypothetical protein